MLHKETVKRETFDLLIKLMQDEHLKGFNLAGGTALALYLGHRISIDLDLFSPDRFTETDLEKFLVEAYDFEGDFLEVCTLKGGIDDIKVDLITHDYPKVKPFNVIEGVRLYSMEDIAAMKLSAIADSGTRLKDFVDIAFLSSKISLETMLQAYEIKYKNANRIRPIKGLTYYDDIDRNDKIQLVKGKYDWKKINTRLLNMIKYPDKIFEAL